MPPITRKEFAAKVKAKYPEYGGIDDDELVNKMVAKYPEYKSEISDFDIVAQPEKKKDGEFIGRSSKYGFGAIGQTLEKPKDLFVKKPINYKPEVQPKQVMGRLEELYNKRKAAQTEVTNQFSYGLRGMPQSEVDSYNAPYTKQIQEADEEIRVQKNLVKPVINAAASQAAKNWQSFMKDGAVDYEKLYNLAGGYSERYGGGGGVKEDFAQSMIDAVNAAQIQSKADVKFKEKTGRTPSEYIEEIKSRRDVTKDDISYLENTYKESVNDVVQSEQEMREGLADALPLQLKMGAQFLGALKGGIASKGSGLASLGINNSFTDYLRGFKTGADQMQLPTKDWTTENLTSDPIGTILPFVAQQAGASLPSMAAGLAVGLATGSGPAGAVVSMLDEKLSNTGDTYQTLIDQGIPQNIAKERSAALMAPMLTDALNFVEMDFLLKAAKGKGSFLLNTFGTGLTEVPTEYEQQFAQERAINPDITVDEFLDKVGGAKLGLQTFVSAAAMGGSVSALGKTVEVLSRKIPNIATQKIQTVIQNQGVEAAREMVASQQEDGVLTTPEIEQMQGKVDEIEKVDTALSEMGIAPNVRLAATTLSDQITELNGKLAQQTSPAIIAQLMQQRQLLQQEMDDILTGKKGFVMITPETGTPYAVPESAAKDAVAELSDEIKTGKVKAEKVGKVDVEIPKQEAPPKPARRLPKLTLTPESENLQKVSESDALSEKSISEPVQEVVGDAKGEVPALRDVESISLRGVKYSDIVVGDKYLEDILSDNKLSEDEKQQVREIFSRGVDYFKFDKEGEQKFQEKFANLEDITDVADIITGLSSAQESAFNLYNTKNYDNVKDAVNYISSNPNDYSPKVVKAIKEIKQKLDNPSSSMNRLYAVDVMKELGLKSESLLSKEQTPQSETKTEVSLQKEKDVNQKAEDTELDAEILKVGKPQPKIQFLSPQELVASAEPVKYNADQKVIKEKYKSLKSLIDCLWA